VRIPGNAIISDDKIIRYLLVVKARSDKSKFLAQAGFTQDDPEALRDAIRVLIQEGEAIEDGSNEYGIFYKVIGNLKGTNGISLAVATIWLKRKLDGKFQFVTLKPYRES